MKNGKPTNILVLSFLFMIISSVGLANSQSKDRDKPTPLTSNVVSGTLSTDRGKESYYYSCIAGPGEVTITLTVDSATGSNLDQVQFDLYDEDEVRIASQLARACCGKSGQAVARVNITRRQSVLLGISISEYHYGGGKYRIRLGGAVTFGQDTEENKRLEKKMLDEIAAMEVNDIFDPTPRLREESQSRNTDNPECLPKKGILYVRMKDGSIKSIDLSQVKEITLEPER